MRTLRWPRKAVAALTAVALLVSLCIPFHSAAARFYGDVDRNGTVSTADVRSLLWYTVGKEALDGEQLSLADYNEDGEVSSADARAMLLAITAGTADKPFETEEPLLASAYNGSPFVILDDNKPRFTYAEKQSTEAFEIYALLDDLGRCGVAYANLCRELMPTQDRESLTSVTPTGWHNRQYDFVSGGWVYNRCHLIGFQLAGEQANKQNLITGTRYLNTEGMLPFENMIADYIKETDNHVLYRATPIFVGDRLLAEGVRIEAWSVEDHGEGICLHVFCYNVQPGVVFDYATGENAAAEETPAEGTATYILNTSSQKFHLPDCGNAQTISDPNRVIYTGHRDDLIAEGYTPCGNCDP